MHARRQQLRGCRSGHARNDAQSAGGFRPYRPQFGSGFCDRALPRLSARPSVPLCRAAGFCRSSAERGIGLRSRFIRPRRADADTARSRRRDALGAADGSKRGHRAVLPHRPGSGLLVRGRGRQHALAGAEGHDPMDRPCARWSHGALPLDYDAEPRRRGGPGTGLALRAGEGAWPRHRRRAGGVGSVRRRRRLLRRAARAASGAQACRRRLPVDHPDLGGAWSAARRAGRSGGKDGPSAFRDADRSDDLADRRSLLHLSGQQRKEGAVDDGRIHVRIGAAQAQESLAGRRHPERGDRRCFCRQHEHRGDPALSDRCAADAGRRRDGASAAYSVRLPPAADRHLLADRSRPGGIRRRAAGALAQRARGSRNHRHQFGGRG
ncbi:hypothetical protein BN871_AG_00100 [Paenibacillus sp. P22]|nr:hypothetical protein BN871_AG_00100 [Paenibacillus sp. P22]